MILAFIPKWALVAACAGSLALCGMQTLRLSAEKSSHADTRTEFADYRAEAERLAREASERNRQKEQELTHAVTQAQAQADAIRQDLDRARAAAGVAASRLRDAAATAALAAGVQCAGSTAAAVSETAAASARMLARVLDELDQRAGALAEHADRSRAAGLQCEALHDAAVSATR